MSESPQLASPFRFKQRRKHLVTISLAVCALLLAMGFFALYLRGQKTGIQILEPTADLSIKLNGRAATPETNDRGLFVPLYAGQYRIELDKAGYIPFTQDIQAAPGSILEIRPAFTLLPSVQQTTGATIDFVRPAADEQSVYYLGDFRQRLFRLEVASQVTVPLTDTPLSGVVDVEWGSNPDVALIVQTDGTYLHEIPRFDFEHQIYTKVAGTEVISPVWDPNDPTRIAAAYYTPEGEHSLVLADKQFKTITRVSTLTNIPSPKVIWAPSSDYLLLLGRSSQSNLENLWMYTLASGKLEQLTPDGNVKNAVFSPDSSKILFEQSDQTGQTTRSVISLDTNKIQPVEGNTPLGQVAWKDSSSFYEAGAGNQTLVLRNLNGSTDATPLSLPQNESIQNLFYYSQPAKVIVSTRTAVYTVNLEKK